MNSPASRKRKRLHWLAIACAVTTRKNGTNMRKVSTALPRKTAWSPTYCPMKPPTSGPRASAPNPRHWAKGRQELRFRREGNEQCYLDKTDRNTMVAGHLTP